eukprot:251233_1
MQSSLDKFLIKTAKLPINVNGIQKELVYKVNKSIIIISTNIKKQSQLGRGKYKQLSDTQRFELAREAHKLNSPTRACKSIKYHHLNANSHSVRDWKIKYEKSIKELGREPRDATEAGLVRQKRGPKSLLGETNKTKIITYLKSMRDSGADVNKYTTSALIISYYKHTNQNNKLWKHGGWINPMSRGLHAELWNKAGYVKRKKTRKRRGEIKRDIGYIASKYKMRCKLTKLKYNIHDSLDMNADETNTDMVPISQYTMDSKGSKHVIGEKLDDKRNITCMLGGAKTGEAMKCQYINKGKTTRCHPKFDEEKLPPNMYMDHSYNTWSDEETIMNYAKDVVVPFKNEQIQKHNLPENSHALLRWDIYYVHLFDSVIKYLLSHNVHVVIVPPDTTDDLQQMDQSVNAGFKYKLKLNFTEDRAKKSIEELLVGIDCDKIHMDYHLKALKNKHVKWVSNAWKYCEDKDLIRKSFDIVENNCVGYSSWNDNRIANEYCKRNARKWKKELKILTSGKQEIESDSDDEDDDIKTNDKKNDKKDNPQEIAFYRNNRNNNKSELVRTYVTHKPKKNKKKGKKKSKKSKKKVKKCNRAPKRKKK